MHTKQTVTAHSAATTADWKRTILENWRSDCRADRWWAWLQALSWIHIAVYCVCQALYTNNIRMPVVFVGLWLAELIAVLFAVRMIAGPGWHGRSPIIGYAVRVWATFLILSFNMASLNTLMGWNADWFKLGWAPLSTFGFAAMAYASTAWFFVPAVQMYFTGLLMVAFPQWSYLIYGASWFLALNIVAAALKRQALYGKVFGAGIQRESKVAASN